MKTLVYWGGVILIGFGVWVSFIALWFYLATNPPYYVPFDHNSGPIILMIGVIIFTFIGWQMMKEGR